MDSKKRRIEIEMAAADVFDVHTRVTALQKRLADLVGEYPELNDCLPDFEWDCVLKARHTLYGIAWKLEGQARHAKDD